MAHPQAVTFLKAGIVAARAGNKVEMRSMLRQATELDPGNESAWLWRANCADTPDESLDCLRKALALNPNSPIARAGLPDAMVRAAVACAADRPRARKLLEEATALDARHELAWLWRAGLADAPDQAVAYLRRVLTINPDNKKARAGLAHSEALAARVWHCPICAAKTNDPKPTCANCRCVLTLENPAAFDGARPTNRPVVEAAAKRLHAAFRQSPSATSAFSLGLAYLNLGFQEQGVQAVQAAALQQGANPQWAAQLEAFLRHRPATPGRAADSRPLVLVVDDSPTIRKMVAVTLGAAGYRVVEADSGVAAARSVHDGGAPGLFLLDVTMPEMDGFTLCKLLRSNPVTAETPVVFLTGKDGLLSKLRGHWAGASDYLTKPFDPQKLLAAVGKLLPVTAAT